MITKLLSFFLICFIIYIFAFDGKNPFKKGKAKGTLTTDTKKATKSNNTKKNAEPKIINSRDILDFSNIKTVNHDTGDALIIKQDENEFIAAIGVTGINISMLSQSEEIDLEESFSSLLNGIDYEIQFFVQSKKIDIENYIKKYKSRLEAIESELKEELNEFNKHNTGPYAGNNNLNSRKLKISRLQNQLEYGYSILDYIIKRCSGDEMIEKDYYIILSRQELTPEVSSKKEKLESNELQLKNAYFNLRNKATNIINSLNGMNLNAKFLNAIELGELLYTSYNKQDAEYIKFKKSLKREFNDFYVTAKPTELKRIEKQIDELEKESEVIA